MNYPLLASVLLLAVCGGAAYVYASRLNANASTATSTFLHTAFQQFAAMRRAGEIDPVWVIASGSVNGALGVTNQRLLVTTVAGLEAIDRRDVVSSSALPKNFGGARHLWGHEVTLELRDGRRHVLTVIDHADYLPPEHDVTSVLARLRAQPGS